MLNDRIINAAQQLIKKGAPAVGGIQDTLLAQRFDRNPYESVQIHHTGECHWVTSSSIGGHVSLYDSLHHGMTDSTQVQLAQCYNGLVDAMDELTVDIPSVQQQSGSVDCGLFAEAYAFELANGKRPSDVVFDQKRMRSHLLDCIESGKLTPFPRSRKDTLRPNINEHNMEVIRTI